MNREKGIVVDVTDTHIVLMSVTDGVFKNIPRPPDYVPLLGEEMEIAQITKRKLKPWAKYASVACMALLLFSAIIMFMQKKTEETYMVALDINPSLELYMDSRNQVTRIVARNRDGEQVMRNIEYKDKSLRNVMKLVIDTCVEMDFLKPDRKKTIRSTLTPLSDAPPIQVTEVKEMIIQPLFEKKVNAEVEVTTGNAKMLEVSEKLDISVNKVKLYEQLQEQHVPITVEDVQNTPIDKLEKQSEMSQDKDTDHMTQQIGSDSSHPAGEADGSHETPDSETRAADSNDSVESGHNEPDAINPNHDGAELKEPDTKEEKLEAPDIEGLETAGPDSAGTDVTGAEEAPADPETEETEAASPDAAEPEEASPDPAGPEKAEPQAADPTPTGSEPLNPDGE